MSNPVNPPPQLRIPDSLVADRETFGYFRQLNQILFQLWTRTGGSDDTISDVEESGESGANTSILYTTISRQGKRISDLEGSGEDGANTSRLHAIISILGKRISELEESGESGSNTTISRLEKRISDLEGSNDSEILISKFTKLNSKVNKLIEELLVAVRALAPDLEQESEKVVLLANIRDELLLLNARTEEAFETELDGEDI